MIATAWPVYLSVLAGFSGVVTLLYWLKPPPRTVVVPSSLVWERVLRESQPRPDRLRWWLSLLLAVLIVCVLVSAILKPRGAASEGTDARLVVIVDNSPTMAARTTDGATRWDHALTRARSVIESRPAAAQVWLADTMRRIVTPAFGSRDDALDQLAGLRVAHGYAPILPLPEVSLQIETVVITDGVSIGPLPRHVRVESVFESVENAGITAFEVRRLPADARRFVAHVGVANASGIDKRLDLAIVGVGGKRVSRTIEVEPGGLRSERFDLSNFDGGPVRATLAMPGDALALDDLAYAVLPVHRVMRVALVSAGNAPLAESLHAQPRVNLTVIRPRDYAGDRGFDAVVFDRYAPEDRPNVPALLFLPGPAGWLPTRGRHITDVSAGTWNAAHPLLDNISLLDLTVKRATVADPKVRRDAAQTVLASAAGGAPLMLAHDDETRWILFSFALEDSNFPLHAGFPIFLNNALNWLLAEQPVMTRGLGLINVPMPGARVVAADGKELAIQATGGGSQFEADAPGLFTIVSAHRRTSVAVNLLDRQTTDVNKSPLAQFQPVAQPPDEMDRIRRLDAGLALLLGAVLLLLFEWWSWNRRLTV